MTFLEAMQKLKEGKKVRNIRWLPGNYIILMQDSDKIVTNEGNIVYNIAPNGLWELYTKVILTNEEKEYIRNTIKFCWCPVEEITLLDKKRSVVLRFSSSCGDVDLSFYFKKDYFKNMEPNRPYTLKELGLDD